MILDSPLLSERYFFPRRAAVPNPFWVECDGARLSCHRDARHVGGYTFLHFHGNGEIVTDYCETNPWLMLPCYAMILWYAASGHKIRSWRGA